LENGLASSSTLKTKDQLLIPHGFAHGFSVLSEIAVIQYKCDNVYNSQYERGINVNDPSLDIYWKLGSTVPVISEKGHCTASFKRC